MRRLVLGLGLLALSACAEQAPDHSFPIFFTPFSSTIDVPGTAIVAQAAATAKRVPQAAVHVTGYADPVAGPIDNVELSKARAAVVAALLVQDGVPASVITQEAGGVPPNGQPGVVDRRAEIDINSP